jgi:hypothetical protein
MLASNADCLRGGNLYVFGIELAEPDSFGVGYAKPHTDEAKPMESPDLTHPLMVHHEALDLGMRKHTGQRPLHAGDLDAAPKY